MKDKSVSAFLCHVVIMLFINSAMLNNAKPATEGKFEWCIVPRDKWE